MKVKKIYTIEESFIYGSFSIYFIFPTIKTCSIKSYDVLELLKNGDYIISIGNDTMTIKKEDAFVKYEEVKKREIKIQKQIREWNKKERKEADERNDEIRKMRNKDLLSYLPKKEKEKEKSYISKIIDFFINKKEKNND